MSFGRGALLWLLGIPASRRSSFVGLIVISAKVSSQARLRRQRWQTRSWQKRSVFREMPVSLARMVDMAFSSTKKEIAGRSARDWRDVTRLPPSARGC